MPALFMDLDGTIRYSKTGEFIQNVNDIALFADVEDKLWEYRDKGWLLCGISNQGGIAHGYKTMDDVAREMAATMRLFKRTGLFHAMTCCGNEENGTVEPYCHRSLMRKPYIGMLVQTEHDMRQRGIIIDWPKSMMVGDREEDQQCAANAGIAFQWAHDFFGRVQ